METTQPLEQNIHINCYKHPTETIHKISTKIDSNPHVFCLECLIENPPSSSDILNISEFLTIADEFYKNNAQKPTTRDLKPSPEYISAIGDQKKALDDLKEHLRQEREKIDSFFDEIKKTFIHLLDEQKRERLAELDQQLFRLQYWHLFFEKRLRMTFSNAPDFNSIFFNSEDPLSQRLQTIKDPLQFEAYVRSIKEDLNEEILRINKPKPLDQDKKFKLPYLHKKLLEQQNVKPVYNISESVDPQKQLKINIQDLLEKMLSIENSIPDVLDHCNCPDSQIIDASHYKLLQEWLSEVYKNQSLKLLYRGTRDGMNSRAFHKKCDNMGPTITLISCRFSNSNQMAIIGGFLDKDWHSNNNWIASNQAFIFSLTEKVKCPLAVKEYDYSAYGKEDLGPTFGMAYELSLDENFQKNYVYHHGEYKNSHLLIDRKNQKSVFEFGNEGSKGMNYFKAEEVEVYTFK